jgi:hypothetical protein
MPDTKDAPVEFSLTETALRLLKEGEDHLARTEMSRAIERVILQSDMGLIALAEFVERIEAILSEGKAILSKGELH